MRSCYAFLLSRSLEDDELFVLIAAVGITKSDHHRIFSLFDLRKPSVTGRLDPDDRGLPEILRELETKHMLRRQARYTYKSTNEGNAVRHPYANLKARLYLNGNLTLVEKDRLSTIPKLRRAMADACEREQEAAGFT